MKRLLLILLLVAGPALAVDPSEMLSDPLLEDRARALDDQIRCVKCQSEAVSSSNAEWARDARRMIRDLVDGGATNQEVLDWFQVRYGDFVLMDPPKKGSNWILWLAGPVLLLLGAGAGYLTITARRQTQPEADLSPEEQARLAELVSDDT